MSVVQSVVLNPLGEMAVATPEDILATPTSNVEVPGLVLPPGSLGRILYVSGPATVSRTDAASLATCLALGVDAGIPGSVRKAGVVVGAFTTVGGAPANGALVWAALAADDGGTAAGKFTAAIPLGAGQTIQPMGNVLDNSGYAGSRTCVVSLNIVVPLAVVAPGGVLKPALPGTPVPVASEVELAEMVTAARPFSTLAFGVANNVASGTRFLYLGTVAGSMSEVFLRFTRSVVVVAIAVRAVTGPGAARTDTWTVRRNGVDTLGVVSLTGAATAALATPAAIPFGTGDNFSLRAVVSAGSTLADLQILVEYRAA